MKRLLLPLPALFFFLPQAAAAVAYLPTVYCSGLPGCPSAPVGPQEFITSVMNIISDRFSVYALILGTLFVMVGGAYILFAGLSEENVTKGKNTIIWALVGVFVVTVAATVINNFLAPEAGGVLITGDLVVNVATILKDDIFSLLKLALVFIALYNGMRMVASRGADEEYTKARTALLWAVLGAVIIQLAGTAVNVILNI